MDNESLNLKNQLCFPLYAASREVIKKYKPLLDNIGLTYTQYIVMMVLWEEEIISVKDLGDKLFLDSGTLTPLLKKMEQMELLTRQRSRTDERSVIVCLTKNGIELKASAENIPLEMGKTINLTPEEMRTLYELLYKILE